MKALWLPKLRRGASAFLSGERGSMSAFGLFLIVVSIGIGGLAIDFSNAMRTRTQLQAAADSAAHAALVARQTMSEDEAIQVGLAMAYATAPASVHGQFIEAGDFIFGRWDRAARHFSEELGSIDAVLVDTARIAARANPLRTQFLRVIGVRQWDVLRRAIYETYVPRCTIEGFMSEVLVDVTSVNVYRSGYCLHSNGSMEMQNNSIFEPGAIVAMPNLNNLVLPTAGMDSNIGLAEALRPAYYDIGVTERIDFMLNNVTVPGSPVYPADYLTSSEIVQVNAGNKYDETDWAEGRINQVNCPNSNGRLRISTDTVLRNGVLITNCRVVFGQGAALEDVILITTSTHIDSITGAAAVRLGHDDNCAPGGDVQVLTMGGVSFPSSLALFGARIVAEREVTFTAQADAVEGASILSNGPIVGTANGEAAICGADGMPAPGWRRYFRLVS